MWVDHISFFFIEYFISTCLITYKHNAFGINSNHNAINIKTISSSHVRVFAPFACICMAITTNNLLYVKLEGIK